MPTPLRILIVEDSADDAELLLHELRRGGYEPVHQIVDSAAAMNAALSEHQWDIVASDHSVLQFDSLAALNLLKASGLDTPFIIVSGTIGEETAVQAMKAGAVDFLVKGRLARLNAVVQRELAEAEQRRARRHAEHEVREQEQRAILELATAYEATLEGWVRALDLRDRETEGHSRRVTDLTVRLARKLGIDDATLVHIRRGALLHDIGKMAIPDEILHKAGPLTDTEWEIMQRHPKYALGFIEPIEYLQPALDIPYCHHEKWDGTGYPRGLRGEEIPLAARMFAAVDIWDAVRSDRPYRAAWTNEEARAHIASLAGTHLDPAIARSFLELVERPEAMQTAPLRPLPHRMAAKIVVADDYPANLLLLARWLRADGYEVLTAGSGSEALALVKQARPSLVLLDIDMPTPDGLEVCRQLKANPLTAAIPVLFLTGAEAGTIDSSIEQVGAEGYLTKPVDAHMLRTRVRAVLEHTSH